MVSANRNTSRKNAARALASQLRLTYTEALRHVTRNAEARQPRGLWVLTDDVRAWFAGAGWRAIRYPDLYDWLDNEVSPAYDCDWCDEPGDAREVDSSISLVITAYDPDLSPATLHVASRKFHAACQPSSIVWVHKVDIPAGPQRIGLPASADPDLVGEFELDVRPLLRAGDDEYDEQAVLLLTARVVDDLGEGPGPWLNEFRLHLAHQGFGHPDELMTESATDWSLRIVTDYPSSLAPQWIALRSGAADDMTAQPMLLCALDLPGDWVEVARRTERVAVVVGPCTTHWDEPGVAAGAVEDELLHQHQGDSGLDSGGCRCSVLTLDQVAELLETSFVTRDIRVLADKENS